MSDDVQPTDLGPAGASLELRVTSGVHAGARIALPPASETGSATLSIGPGLDHDVVLSDAPGSAQVRLEGGEWHWTEQDFKATVRSGGGWKWGPILLGLAPTNAAWSAPGALLFDRSALRSQIAVNREAGASSPLSPAADTPDRSGAGEATDSVEAAEATSGDATSLSSETITAPATPRSTGRRSSALAGLGILALLLFGWLLMMFLQRPPAERPVARAAPEQLTPALAADPLAVSAALAGAGLDRRVRVIPLADGRVRLSGVVADDDELDRAIAAVRRSTSRIVQGILTQREFAARLAELQLEAPQPVSLRAAPVGRVLLLDAERPGLDLAGLKSWLAQVLPEAQELERVEAKRLAEAIATPGTAALAVAPPPPPPVTAIGPLPTVPADQPPLPDLPEIRLVMGGSSPYVVLASGEKWLPGGRVGGWYLTSIEAQALILEDGLGRRLRSPR